MNEPVVRPDEDDDPNEVENAWAATIERRRREVREGTVKTIPSDALLDELRAWKPKSAR